LDDELPAPIPALGKGDKPKNTKSKNFEKQKFTRCLDSHPELKIGGGVFYGGSCSSPIIDDCDIYIGFQSGMLKTNRQWPWTSGHDIEFRVTDFHAPDKKHTKAYIELVDWTVEQLASGTRVHAGCIGGHGRTGMFLAAIMARLGEENPIAWTREHYCDRATESIEQVKFLHENFGCEVDAEPAKHRGGLGIGGGTDKDWPEGDITWRSPVEKYRNKYGTPKAEEKPHVVKPTPTSANVWGDTLDPESY
jgi:hypothetical protein